MKHPCICNTRLVQIDDEVLVRELCCHYCHQKFKKRDGLLTFDGHSFHADCFKYAAMQLYGWQWILANGNSPLRHCDFEMRCRGLEGLKIGLRYNKSTYSTMILIR